MAYAWTSPDADCTIIATQPPADGIAFAEVRDGTDPCMVYVTPDGDLLDVPPRTDPRFRFSPAMGSWLDPRSDAECWAELRRERDLRLRATDWTQAADAPLSAEQRDAWQQYRQGLRDFPATIPDPRNPSWPLPPTADDASSVAAE